MCHIIGATAVDFGNRYIGITCCKINIKEPLTIPKCSVQLSIYCVRVGSQTLTQEGKACSFVHVGQNHERLHFINKGTHHNKNVISVNAHLSDDDRSMGLLLLHSIVREAHQCTNIWGEL
eukprot:6232655-Amphidinium_carterae.1